jgi:hypothetical protein
MKGQAKAMIPALIGIVPLLLAGITGFVNSSGGQQTTAIAETRAVTLEEHQRMQLGDSVRADAEAAADALFDDVAADLSVGLTYSPTLLIASSDGGLNDRG